MANISKTLVDYGFTTELISKKTGLAIDRVEEILKGADPTLHELNKIVDKLGLSFKSFTDLKTNEAKAAILFRNSINGESTPYNLDAINKFSIRINNASIAMHENAGNFSWLSNFEKASLDYDSAEYHAEKFRSLFFNNDFVSPINNLPSICSSLNIQLFVVNERDVEGASAILNGQVFIFLSNRSFKPRMLFTLAHELGHLVAGHHDKENFASFDAEGAIGSSYKGKPLIEKFADAFASALLMPAKGVGIALKKIKETTGGSLDNIGDIDILYLARIYSTSFETAARRCETLQLLPPGGARSLVDFVEKNYDSAEKRADVLGLPPRTEISFQKMPSELFEWAIRRIYKGDVSVGSIAADLGLTIQDLYAYNHNRQPFVRH